MKIPITSPFFDTEDKKAITATLETGWISQGPKVENFENIFSKFCDTKFSIATSSCSTALHICLAGFGVKPGDEVIIPAFTFVATANVIEYLGAKPVFCDIDLATYNIDVSQIENKITDKTKAIIPVHLFGLCAEMNPIIEMAKKYNLKIVEDAACALGAYYHGKHPGNFGFPACFSFHPRKSITTGEGGMITTDNPTLNLMYRSLRNHGWENCRDEACLVSTEPDLNILGYNYRMTDIQGALGVSQVKKLKKLLAKRSMLAKKYDKAFEDIDELITPFVPKNHLHAYQSYVCLLKSKKTISYDLENMNKRRNSLMKKLEESGVSSRQGTYCVPMLGYYKNKYNYSGNDFPNSFIADKLSITIPLYPQMTAEEHNYVVDSIIKIYSAR